MFNKPISMNRNVQVAAKSKEFCLLSREQLLSLISSSRLLVSSEGAVYKAVVGKHNLHQRSSVGPKQRIIFTVFCRRTNKPPPEEGEGGGLPTPRPLILLPTPRPLTQPPPPPPPPPHHAPRSHLLPECGNASPSHPPPGLSPSHPLPGLTPSHPLPGLLPSHPFPSLSLSS